MKANKGVRHDFVVVSTLVCHGGNTVYQFDYSACDLH